ncbi:Hypothetical protein (Fragment) [Durusdinium trenchii]|uniref:Uncharacterized protein n=1 Tax=Durusdinium trenchii TaxID=1381693 RepID=A0ABP0I849_9DINO
MFHYNHCVEIMTKEAMIHTERRSCTAPAGTGCFGLGRSRSLTAAVAPASRPNEHADRQHQILRGACSLEHLLVALETTIRAQLAMPRSSGFSHFVEKVAAADSDAQKDGVEVLFGLCGTWHGTWQRLSVEGPSLKSAQRFRATCAPCVAADGESVHHVNRYPPEVAPKPGLLGSDGMMEVDFGQMNKSNFLQPFGPRSSASYGSGWAALYPSSWQTERLAVELISRVGAQRHRLIAMWQRKDEDWVSRVIRCWFCFKGSRSGSHGVWFCPSRGLLQNWPRRVFDPDGHSKPVATGSPSPSHTPTHRHPARRRCRAPTDRPADRLDVPGRGVDDADLHPRVPSGRVRARLRNRVFGAR